ncbi:cytochrome P450 704C1-like isoform X1 [Wolffia australiana]
MDMALFVPVLFIILLGVPLFYVLLQGHWRIRRRRQYHPMVGTFFDQRKNFSRLYDYHTEISRRHLSFRILSSSFTSEIYTNDPAVIEHILSTNLYNYGKQRRHFSLTAPATGLFIDLSYWVLLLGLNHDPGFDTVGSYTYDIMKDLFGDGIFIVDGAKWRHQRKLAGSMLSTRSLKEASTTAFKKKAIMLASILGEAADTDKEIDLQDIFTKVTMDSLFQVFFGMDPNHLQNTNGETKQFVQALDKSNELINARFVDPLWKLKKFLNIGSAAVLKEKIKTVDDYLFKLIRSEINRIENTKEVRQDLLARFLDERSSDPETLTDKYLRDIILNFVVSGKDTTASCLAWFFYLMCVNPNIERTIIDEITDSVGAPGTETYEEFTGKLNEESLGKMKFFHAALIETLRLYPSLPMNGRVCISDDTLPDGCDIRAGEFIVFQPYCMGRMKSLWGEDAEIFRPERWIDAAGNLITENPFKFTPFRGGPGFALERSSLTVR